MHFASSLAYFYKAFYLLVLLFRYGSPQSYEGFVRIANVSNFSFFLTKLSISWTFCWIKFWSKEQNLCYLLETSNKIDRYVECRILCAICLYPNSCIGIFIFVFFIYLWENRNDIILIIQDPLIVFNSSIKDYKE